ncbi:hypothetical protein RAY_184 [Erwinia phage vB_EamM_RAY]|jgi:hypothetical protein|uniref:Uncharacterized protein n=10 Tax=Agricanvirus TaxID=1984776 RepID=A0A173GEK2_9CAUD|nr:hypothetical protein FDH97_gp190 [Erwinia phage vB_EamM_Deimos-Minion]YP_009605651.1 hypothetical protein FDH98_gp184 [Erwinia phage vB_EamM_RAY]YP_009605971.1 hypothetical protein FDH99_gp187 [Erwinia phage vB_EamM_Simmy50]YP_009606292.1 hypothetical protein FDI00_gp186 [Erwinia phage vB_EamM_Special G]YP_009621926.1 hypothetical protein FDJ23_gp185 [Erwinia phage vB_EamM_Desertfox]AUG85973.1 hypothetical protein BOSOLAPHORUS_186 [Erwinia phage vB_EamM_Bosolaphorus]AUG86614.1 hypothetical
MSQSNREVIMVDPKELEVLMGLIRQLEHSPLPQNPSNILQEGMSELGDRIINKIRRHVTGPYGYTNADFVSVMQAHGYSVLPLLQDLVCPTLYGLPTTKGMIQVKPMHMH